MNKKRLTFIIISLIITLQLFNGIFFGSNVNSTALPFNNDSLYLNISGFSNATVISENTPQWNFGSSNNPNIAVDRSGNIHVVWWDNTAGAWGADEEIMYAKYTSGGWSKALVISDIYGWNDGPSWNPDIAVDLSGNLHVVWQDASTGGWWGDHQEAYYINYTAGVWSNATVISDDYTLWHTSNVYSPNIAVDGSGNLHVVWTDASFGDYEILYVNYTAGVWSNVTAISDVYGWNTGSSQYQDIAVDGSGNVHVVWHDDTDGEWGTDREIMYAKCTAGVWSNATVISDNTGWNNDSSEFPSIAVDDSGSVHVVWHDDTNGEWGTDREIMYANYTSGVWSNATVISDVYGWNNGGSEYPDICVKGSGKVYVVWHDDTNGEWGTDREIMYTNYSAAGWSNATVVSDLDGWNWGQSDEPVIAVDGSSNVHVVWEDGTDGWWGTDVEIMYAKIGVAKEERVPLELLLMALSLSQPGLIEQLPLILVGIGIVVVVVIIIVVIKKRK